MSADERSQLLAGDDNDVLTTPQSTMEIICEEIRHVKWRILVFCCFLTFGSYYIYDFPGAIGSGPENTIQAKFVAHGKEYNHEMNQLLYSVYSWPNTVLAIFGGLLIDKLLGLRRAMILFVVLVTIGAGLFYVGVATLNYPLLVVARVIFGLGGESLSVAQSAFVARWFRDGRGMALAFGITVSFSRVGSSFNFLFSPMIAKDINIDMSVLFGLVACCFSAISCAVLVAADVYGERRGLVTPEARGQIFPCQISFNDVKRVPLTVWLICGACVFSYTSIFPFVGIAKNFFQVKYGDTMDDASRWVSVYQFVCAGGSPIVGGIVDGAARNTFFVMAATILFAVIHLLFITTKIPPGAQMAFMGVVYSMLVSSLWPAVPFAVNASDVGFAYGIMTALQNLGLAIFPIIVGAILDDFPGHNPLVGNSTNTTNGTILQNNTQFQFMLDLYDASEGFVYAVSNSTPAPTHKAPLPELEGYKYTELLFMCSALVAFVFAFLLMVVDFRGNGILGASASRRKEIDAELKALEDEAAKKESLLNRSGDTTPA